MFLLLQQRASELADVFVEQRLTAADGNDRTPHSSTAARHFSMGTTSLIVSSYSRMRPQPVQVKLHACNGSSIITRGKRFTPLAFCRMMYFAMSA